MIKKKSRRRDGGDDDDNGFAQWGGYMAAKISKLENQFSKEVDKEERKKSDIFKGVSIFVNGYTNPTADQLKQIMMLHGGVYCHYESRHTTHIIASNLPDCKVKQLKTLNVVKPEWIVDSLKAGILLDYKKYLLYSNNSRSQPKLNFPALNISKASFIKHSGNSNITSVKDTVEISNSENTADEKDNTQSTSDPLCQQNLRSKKSVQNYLTEEEDKSLKYITKLSSKNCEKIADQCKVVVSDNISEYIVSNISENQKFMATCSNVQLTSINYVANNETEASIHEKGNSEKEKQSTYSGADIANQRKVKNISKHSMASDDLKEYPEIGNVVSSTACNMESKVEEDEISKVHDKKCPRIQSDNCNSQGKTPKTKIPSESNHAGSFCNVGSDTSSPTTSCKYSSPEKNLDITPDRVKTYSNSKKSKTSIDPKRTAVNPEFLSEFYGNSRLHHLSTMGATFKEYVAKLHEQNSGNFPGVKRLIEWKKRHGVPCKVGEDDDFFNDALVSNSDLSIQNNEKQQKRTVMHVDMDCFFVSVGLRTRPELRGEPVAVTHAKKNVSLEKEGSNLQFEKEFYKQRFQKRVQKHSGKTSDCEIPRMSRIDNVCETDSLAEIASCNYEARKAGVRNGMFFGSAVKLCPNLKTIPYDFDGYKEVSYKLYDILASYTLNIEAVSCDEMYVDCTELLKNTNTTSLEFASLLRKEIQDATGCCASVGIGSNPLQARLATKKAKPNGQFHLTPHEVERFMLEIDVKDLPGVGSSLASRLHSEGIFSCRDLQRMSLSSLQKRFGQKTGQALHHHSRGEDNRALDTCHKRKSVSAEVNYGIRFTTQTEAEDFLRRLSNEVSERLKKIRSKGRVLTLKLMVRAKDAPVETAKYMGHGACDALSRSTTIGVPTDDPNVIFRSPQEATCSHLLWKGLLWTPANMQNPVIVKEAVALEKQLKIVPNDLRGVGIQMARLTNVTVKNNVLTNFLAQAKSAAKETSVSKVGKTTDLELIEDGKNKINEIDSNKMNTYRGLKKVDGESEQSSEVKRDFPDQQIRNNELLKPPDTRIKKDVPRNILNYSSRETDNNLPLIDPPSDMPSMSLAEARKMVQMWILGEARPLECDVLMLASYLQRLIVSHQLEEVDCLLSLMHRLLIHRDKEWKTAYQNIVKYVQDIMQAIYGSKLKVSDF